MMALAKVRTGTGKIMSEQDGGLNHPLKILLKVTLWA